MAAFSFGRFASLDAAKVAHTARKTQYFEIFGNRAIYHDGWMANTVPAVIPPASRRPRTGYRDGQG